MSQATFPVSSLGEKAETPVTASPVLLSGNGQERCYLWMGPPCFIPTVGLRVCHSPSCPEVSRKTLVMCLLLGCVVMATTWDQAGEKQAPIMH